MFVYSQLLISGQIFECVCVCVHSRGNMFSPGGAVKKKPELHSQLVALIKMVKKILAQCKNLTYLPTETYIMELEQTCFRKTFHDAGHLGNGKLFLTTAVQITVVQKSACAARLSIRKGNG